MTVLMSRILEILSKQTDCSPQTEQVQLDCSPQTEQVQLDCSPQTEQVQIDCSPQTEQVQILFQTNFRSLKAVLLQFTPIWSRDHYVSCSGYIEANEMGTRSRAASA
jgi:hypothetical protein